MSVSSKRSSAIVSFPPKWDNLVVSLPVLAFSSKAMVSVYTLLGAMCRNLGGFGLRVDPNPELRHPPSPARFGESKAKLRNAKWEPFPLKTLP